MNDINHLQNCVTLFLIKGRFLGREEQGIIKEIGTIVRDWLDTSGRFSYPITAKGFSGFPAFGSQINGGVFGPKPDFTNLDANDDLVCDISFQEVYTTLLTDWFGMTLTDAQTILQDQTGAVVPLAGLIKSSTGGVAQNPAAALTLSVYPNPTASAATISFDLPVGSYAEIETRGRGVFRMRPQRWRGNHRECQHLDCAI